MSIVDTLITRFVLDASNYKKGAGDVTSATEIMGKTVEASLAKVKWAAAAVGAGIGALAVKSVMAAADFDAQTRALALYETAGWKTADMLKELRQVAKLPGLGVFESVQSAVRLLAGGFDFSLTVRSMLAFGNALAAAGKGKEDLDGVIMALTQIAAKGKVSAEEINQIAERVPQIRKAMQEAFGTANTDDLQKAGLTAEAFIAGIVAQLEKLPKATSGMKNELSNIGDIASYAMITVGTAVNNNALPALQQMNAFLEHMDKSKVFDSLGASIAEIFGLKGDGKNSPMVVLMAYSIAWVEQMVGAIASLKDKILGTIATAANAMGSLLNALPFGMGKGIGDALKALALPGGLIMNLGGNGDPRMAVEGRAKFLLQSFNDATTSPYTPPQGGGFTTSPTGSSDSPTHPAQTELEKQTYLLSSIDRNTSPQRNTILGGGNLGAQGISATDLSRIKGGRRKVDQLARLLQEMMSEEAANQSSQFIRMASPFVSGR